MEFKPWTEIEADERYRKLDPNRQKQIKAQWEKDFQNATPREGQNKSALGDTVTALNIGTTVSPAEVALGLGQQLTNTLAFQNQTGPNTVTKFLAEKVFDPARSALQARREKLSKEYSPSTQTAAQKEYVTKDEEGKYHLGDAFESPSSFIRKTMPAAVESLPLTLAPIGPIGLGAKSVGKAALARQAALKVPKTVAKRRAAREAASMAGKAGAISEGTIGAGMAYNSMQTAIMEMPYDKIIKSPKYQEALTQISTDLTPEQRDIAARQMLAHQAGSQSAAAAALIDSVLGFAGDRYIGDIVMGNAKNRATAALKGAISETPTEGLQSAGERLSENIATKYYADPTQDIYEGVLEEGIGGAAAGGIAGGGFGGVAYSSSTPTIGSSLEDIQASVDAATKRKNLRVLKEKLTDAQLRQIQQSPEVLASYNLTPSDIDTLFEQDRLAKESIDEYQALLDATPEGPIKEGIKAALAGFRSKTLKQAPGSAKPDIPAPPPPTPEGEVLEPTGVDAEGNPTYSVGLEPDALTEEDKTFLDEVYRTPGLKKYSIEDLIRALQLLQISTRKKDEELRYDVEQEIQRRQETPEEPVAIPTQASDPDEEIPAEVQEAIDAETKEPTPIQAAAPDEEIPADVQEAIDAELAEEPVAEEPVAEEPAQEAPWGYKEDGTPVTQADWDAANEVMNDAIGYIDNNVDTSEPTQEPVAEEPTPEPDFYWSSISEAKNLKDDSDKQLRNLRRYIKQLEREEALLLAEKKTIRAAKVRKDLPVQRVKFLRRAAEIPLNQRSTESILYEIELLKNSDLQNALNKDTDVLRSVIDHPDYKKHLDGASRLLKLNSHLVVRGVSEQLTEQELTNAHALASTYKKGALTKSEQVQTPIQPKEASNPELYNTAESRARGLLPTLNQLAENENKPRPSKKRRAFLLKFITEGVEMSPQEVSELIDQIPLEERSQNMLEAQIRIAELVNQTAPTKGLVERFQEVRGHKDIPLAERKEETKKPESKQPVKRQPVEGEQELVADIKKKAKKKQPVTKPKVETPSKTKKPEPKQPVTEQKVETPTKRELGIARGRVTRLTNALNKLKEEGASKNAIATAAGKLNKAIKERDALEARTTNGQAKAKQQSLPEPKKPEPKKPEPKKPEPKKPEPKTPEPKTPEPKTPEPKKPASATPDIEKLSLTELDILKSDVIAYLKQAKEVFNYKSDTLRLLKRHKKLSVKETRDLERLTKEVDKLQNNIKKYEKALTRINASKLAKTKSNKKTNSVDQANKKQKLEQDKRTEQFRPSLKKLQELRLAIGMTATEEEADALVADLSPKDAWTIWNTVDHFGIGKDVMTAEDKELRDAYIKVQERITKVHNLDSLTGLPKDQPKASWIGKKAKLTKQQQAKLVQAMVLAIRNETTETIYDQTGWFNIGSREVPQWVMEINDQEMWLTKLGSRVLDSGSGSYYALSDIISHEKLFKAYPFLKSARIAFVAKEYIGGATGRYIPRNNTILVSRSWDTEKTIIHEIQHAIQAHEDWPKGGSTKSTDAYALEAPTKLIDALITELTEKATRDKARLQKTLARARNSLQFFNEVSVEDYNTLIDLAEVYENAYPKGEFRTASAALQKKYKDLGFAGAFLDSAVSYKTWNSRNNLAPDVMERELRRVTNEAQSDLFAAEQLAKDLEELGTANFLDKDFSKRLLVSQYMGYKLYKALHGEIMAEDTARRMPMSDEERLAKLPEVLKKQGLTIKLTDSKYSASEEPSKTVPKSTIEATVRKLFGSNASRVINVVSWESIKVKLGKGSIPLFNEGDQLAGVYHQGKIYLVEDSITSTDEIYPLVVHEGGHYLLANDPSFESTYKSFLARMAEIANGKGSIKDQRAVKAAIRKALRSNPNGSTELINEEALMYYLQDQANADLTWYKQIVSAIRQLLYKIGINKLTAYDMGQMVAKQLKSNISNYETMLAMRKEAMDARMSWLDKPLAEKWYSALKRTVASFKQKIATPNQWLGMIKNQPGIKQEELDWIGLEEWLNEQQGKVSKEDLESFISANDVQIKEVVKDNALKELYDKYRSLRDKQEEVFYYLSSVLWDKYRYKIEAEESNGTIILFDPSGENAFSKLSSEDLKQFNKEIKDYEDLQDQLDKLNDKMQTVPSLDDGATRYNSYQLSGGKNYKELILTLPEKRTASSDTYTHDHWPEIANPLVHIRFNERTDINGNKVLFLEEIQSDWHQGGRQQGYRNKNFNRKSLLSEKERLQAEVLSTSDTVRRDEAHKRLKEITKELTLGATRVPNAPFKKSWPLLAVKRMVRYAAENGFDKVAWTTGKHQSDRYDIGELIDVDTVYVTEVKENKYDIEIHTVYDEVATDANKTISQIRAMYGPEFAEKVANQEVGFKEYPGEQLVWVNEGMSSFYDKMLPSMLNKEFNKKKWGNAKVEVSNITDPIERGKGYTIAVNGQPTFGFDSKVEAEQELASLQTKNTSNTLELIDNSKLDVSKNVLSLPITTQMKNKALSEGMPKFSVKEGKTQGPLSKADQEAMDLLGDALGRSPEMTDEEFVEAIQAETIEKMIKHTKDPQRKKDLEKLKEFNGIFVRDENQQVTNVFERWLSSPEYYSKRDPAFERIVKHAVNESEVKYLIQKEIEGDFPEFANQFKRQEPEAYEEAARYIRKVDATGKGFYLKLDKKTGHWVVMDPNDIEVDRRVKREDASESLIAHEEAWLGDDHPGQPKLSRNARIFIAEFRGVMARSLAAQNKDLQKQIDVALASGLDVPTLSGGKLTLSDAITASGDLEGTYMPRVRKKAKYFARLTKDGQEHLITFDGYIPKNLLTSKLLDKVLTGISDKLPAAREIQALQKQGWELVELQPTKSLAAEVYDSAAQIQNIDALLTKAMEIAESEGNQKEMEQLNKLLVKAISDLYKEKGNISNRRQRSEKYTTGYETDVVKAAVSHTQQVAAGISKRQTAQNMLYALTGRDYTMAEYMAENPDGTEKGYKAEVAKRRIDPVTQANLYSDARTYIKSILRPTTKWDRVIGYGKAIAVLKYLGFRPASAVVNMTNMLTAVPATIAAHSGTSIAKAYGNVVSAAAKYAAYRFASIEERGMSKKLRDEIWYQISENTKAAGRAVTSWVDFDIKEDYDVFKEITRRGLDAPHFNIEAVRAIQGSWPNAFNKLMQTAMYFFAGAERANRAMTIYAAYQAHKANPNNKNLSMDQLLDLAAHTSDRAHGIYGKAAKPYAVQKWPALDLPYTFMKFQHNYLLNAMEMGFKYKSWGKVGMTMMTPTLLAGAGAFPAFWIAKGVGKALLEALGKDGDDPEEALYQWAEENMGQFAEKTARHGLAGSVLGLSLKGSMAFNSPISKDSIIALGGAPLNVVKDEIAAIDHLAYGEYLKAFEKAAPSIAGGVAKGIRLGTEGYTTMSGAPKFFGPDQAKASLGEMALIMASFNPERLASIQEQIYNDQLVVKDYTADRAKILRRYRKFMLTDPDKRTPAQMEKILKLMEEYNARVERGNPRYRQSYLTWPKLRRSAAQSMKPSKTEYGREIN